jgi:hypothetical protein
MQKECFQLKKKQNIKKVEEKVASDEVMTEMTDFLYKISFNF